MQDTSIIEDDSNSLIQDNNQRKVRHCQKCKQPGHYAPVVQMLFNLMAFTFIFSICYICMINVLIICEILLSY